MGSVWWLEKWGVVLVKISGSFCFFVGLEKLCGI